MELLSIPLAIVFYCSLCLVINKMYHKQEDKFFKPFYCGKYATMVIFISSCVVVMQYIRNYRADSKYFFVGITILLWFMSLSAITDFHEKIIKNKVILACLISGILNITAFLIFEKEYALFRIFDSIAGFILALLVFGVTYFLTKGKLGGGDVKLAAIMGLILGSSKVLASLLYGVVACLIATFILALMKKITLKDAVPFCPFLIVGVWIASFI